MANPSLAALLRAVERWQTVCETDDDCIAVRSAILTADIPALQQLAHQHAEALRKW